MIEDEDGEMVRVCYWLRRKDIEAIRRAKRFTGSMASGARALIQIGDKAKIFLEKDILSKRED